MHRKQVLHDRVMPGKLRLRPGNYAMFYKNGHSQDSCWARDGAQTPVLFCGYCKREPEAALHLYCTQTTFAPGT